MQKPLLVFWALALLILATQCRFLFWRPVEQSIAATWIQEARVYETLLRYESKLSWNPLDAGTISRNHSTDLILHRIGDGAVVSSDLLVSFPGWVLDDSLYTYHAGLLMIQGTGQFGSIENRSVLGIEIAPNLKSAKAEVLLKTTMPVLAAIPSPERSTVAVFLQESEHALRLDFYRFGRASLKQAYLLSSHTFEYENLPDLPQFTWGNDSTKIYLQLEDSEEIFAASIDGSLQSVESFPQCFFQHTAMPFTSKEGRRFNRSDNSLTIIQEDLSEVRMARPIPMITEPELIGEECN